MGLKDKVSLVAEKDFCYLRILLPEEVSIDYATQVITYKLQQVKPEK